MNKKLILSCLLLPFTPSSASLIQSYGYTTGSLSPSINDVNRYSMSDEGSNILDEVEEPNIENLQLVEFSKDPKIETRKEIVIDLDRFYFSVHSVIEKFDHLKMDDGFIYYPDNIKLSELKLFKEQTLSPVKFNFRRSPNFSNLASYKYLLFLLSIISLSSGIEAGFVACAACIEAQPALFISMFETCFPLLGFLPFWLVCMGGTVTVDGLACFALCASPTP